MNTVPSSVGFRRRMTRAEAFAQTRKYLLDAAWDLLGERGYAATTMEQVAERAGFTRQPIYRHFGSKERLFIEVYRQRTRTDIPRTLGSLPLGTPLREVLYQFGCEIAASLDSPDTRRILELVHFVVAHVAREPAKAELVVPILREEINGIAETIGRYAAAAGESLKAPAPELAAGLLGLISGLGVNAVILPRSYPPELFGRSCAALLGMESEAKK